MVPPDNPQPITNVKISRSIAPEAEGVERQCRFVYFGWNKNIYYINIVLDILDYYLFLF